MATEPATNPPPVNFLASLAASLVAEAPKIGPHIHKMKEALQEEEEVLLEAEVVSVEAEVAEAEEEREESKKQAQIKPQD